MPCSRCLADPQPKSFLSPRQCAFDDAGNFTPHNWQCLTLAALPRLGAFKPGIWGRYDQLRLNDSSSVELILAYPPRPTDDDSGDAWYGFIVLTRYKNRGRCNSAVHVGDFWPPEPLTLALAESTIQHMEASQ
jgi:hypothetical protein